jgi:pimeloyl-ACP methyl ester carboxylesterase
LLPLSFACGGCAGLTHEVYTATSVPASRGVVFVADGAGHFQATSQALRRAVQEDGLPVAVETVGWSHGYGRILSDQLDHENIREAGLGLAEQVNLRRATSPGCAVYLLGHSAGAAVVLSAAEALPPDSVDRIILLAPSVAADHDLRPALRCARTGIDSFYSRHDWFYLGLGATVLGTADGSRHSAAGRVGFQPVAMAPEDVPLYAKLRQHPWDWCVAWTGNFGGHYGGYRSRYLRYYVLTLLTDDPVIPAP